MAIKMKTTVTLQSEADCPNHSLSNVLVRDVNFAIDEPLERGGTNLGPTPTDTALAALIGCTNVIGHKCAKSLGVDIGPLKISLACTFDRRGVLLLEEIDLPFPAVDLVVKASGPASQADLDRVAAETAKYCAVSKMFEAAGTEVNITWTPAD